MRSAWNRTLLAGHMLVWAAFASYAYIAPIQGKSSCWTMILMFFFFPLLIVALLSFRYVAIWAFRPSRRPQLPFLMACHGAILTAGLVGSVVAAISAAGPGSCL